MRIAITANMFLLHNPTIPLNPANSLVSSLGLHQRSQNRQPSLLRLHCPAPPIVIWIIRRRCWNRPHHRRHLLVRHVRAAPDLVVGDTLVAHIRRVSRLVVRGRCRAGVGAPVHAKVAGAVASAVGGFGVIADPGGVGATVDGVLRSEVGRGSVGDTLVLADGERFAEDGEVVEEDAFECLGVLATALRGVAGFLQDAVGSNACPGAACSSRPAGSGDDGFDQGVPGVEVAGGARSFPEAAQAGEEDALVVGVDALVALVAFARADV